MTSMDRMAGYPGGRITLKYEIRWTSFSNGPNLADAGEIQSETETDKVSK